MKVKRVVCSFFFISLVLLQSAAVNGQNIRVAYSSISGAMLPLWVTKDGDFFKKHGLDVELVYIPTIALQALIARDVHFIRAAPPTIIKANQAGARVVVIANTVNTPIFSLMAQPNITKMDGLRGKTIGVTTFGASPDFVLSMVLEKWGLERGRDVSVRAIAGMPNLLAAVQTGVVGAGVISPPNNLRGLKAGLRELLDMSEMGIAYMNSPLSTTRSYIGSNRDVVLRFLRAYYEGIKATREQREFSIRTIAKYARVKDPEILNEVYSIYGSKHLERIPYVDPKGVNTILKMTADVGDLKMADFVDNSLLKELEREGFFSGSQK